ncbi:MAG: hypothetical protein BWX55_01042 [Deltaproteobacteria bacterium ADurb.Bin022]|nr:MAG: hypothetical protein BWX55_01042 [Deltaproteobacteria bacterium ADurb.Bin022]
MPAGRGCRRFLFQHRGRSHLSARHSVNGIINEYDGDIFAAIGRVKAFRDADGCQIAIALIGKYDPVGQRAFDG